MTFSTAGAEQYDPLNASQKNGENPWDVPPRGHTTIERVQADIASALQKIRFSVSPTQQRWVALAARPGTEASCQAAARRLVVAAILGLTEGRVGTRAEAIAELRRRHERRTHCHRTGGWLSWGHEALSPRTAAMAFATLVRAGFLTRDRTGAWRIMGFDWTGTAADHRRYASLRQWRQRAYVREADARRRMLASGRRVPVALWHPEPELDAEGRPLSRKRCRLHVPNCGPKRIAGTPKTRCEAYRVNLRSADLGVPAVPPEPAWLSDGPCPEPVPGQTKVACPTRPSGEHTVSDMSHPPDNLPLSPPPVEDPTAQVPERMAEAKGDVAGAPDNPAPPPPPPEPAENGRKYHAGHHMARVLELRAADLAAHRAAAAAAEAAAARKPAAPPPRQGAPGGAAPDPRATVPRRVAPPSRPPPPTPRRPASDGDWRRLSADHHWMRNCDRITVLASQATADQLRQAVERTSEAMRKKPVANPTSYLAMVCRTLVAEAPRYAR